MTAPCAAVTLKADAAASARPDLTNFIIMSGLPRGLAEWPPWPSAMAPGSDSIAISSGRKLRRRQEGVTPVGTGWARSHRTTQNAAVLVSQSGLQVLSTVHPGQL